MNPQDDTPRVARKRGPRGGKTTVSKDGAMVRKTFFIDCDVDEALRKDARKKRLTEAQVLRQLLRDAYGIE
jgi:hypothetical protein